MIEFTELEIEYAYPFFHFISCGPTVAAKLSAF